MRCYQLSYDSTWYLTLRVGKCVSAIGLILDAIGDFSQARQTSNY